MNEIAVEKNALQIHLGAEFEKLDPIVREAHIGQKHLEGFILVERGNIFSNFLCNLLNMPESGNNVWNTVNSYHYSNCMKWERTFNGKPFISNFVISGNYLIETIGAFKLYLVGSVENGALIYRLKYVKWFGIKLPSTFSPSLFASESEENGKYKFVVVVSLPIIGLLIKYSGLIDLCSK